MRPPDGIENIYLKPGELRYSKKPILVTTVLGSCISVTMVSNKLKIGGILHAMLPTNKRNSEENGKSPFNYVDTSIEYIVKQFEKDGVKPSEIEAKLFGGANMFTVNNTRPETVGSQNIQMAVSKLNQLGIRLITSDVGGIQSRKLIFHTSSGEVWLKRMNKEKAL